MAVKVTIGDKDIKDMFDEFRLQRTVFKHFTKTKKLKTLIDNCIHTGKTVLQLNGKYLLISVAEILNCHSDDKKYHDVLLHLELINIIIVGQRVSKVEEQYHVCLFLDDELIDFKNEHELMQYTVHKTAMSISNHLNKPNEVDSNDI